VETGPWQDRIEQHPDVLGGKPVIRGTRLSVELIVGLVVAGAPFEELLRDYPRITADDITACLEFSRRFEVVPAPVR